jgi:hypothetical protein
VHEHQVTTDTTATKQTLLDKQIDTIYSEISQIDHIDRMVFQTDPTDLKSLPLPRKKATVHRLMIHLQKSIKQARNRLKHCTQPITHYFQPQPCPPRSELQRPLPHACSLAAEFDPP